MSAPVDHPPPWKWLGRPDEETALLDGEGYSILSPSNDGGISIRSPYVREVVRAAPEMERLLRKIGGRLDPDTGWCPGCTPYLSGEHDDKCEVIALLSRLDAARKAGG